MVGAGIGGLTSAALLGRAGHHVTLLEAADHVGGKSRRLEVAGQRMDTGPSLFTFPGVWEELLRRLDALGARPHPGPGAQGTQTPAEPGAPAAAQTAALELERLPGVGSYWYRGQRCELPVPPGHPWHGAWTRFAAAHGGLGPDITRLLTTDVLDRAVYPALGRLGRLYGRKLTTRDYLDGLTWLPEGLREVIAIHTLNAGVGPQRTPALYASMPAVMAHDGVWLPRGGVYELVEALRRLAVGAGVEIRTSEPVVSVARGRVTTARAAYPADVVVSGVDAHRLGGLLAGRAPRRPRRLSCSAVAVYAVLDAELPGSTPRHGVVLPDRPAELYAALEAGREPEQTMAFANSYPAGTVHPGSGPTLALLLTAPANGKAYTLDDPFVARELERVSRVLGWPHPVTDRFRHVEILDPAYFAAHGSQGGALYGAVRAPWRAGPFHAPAHHSPLRPWLWRVGASVHPGGGLPAVLGGAMISTGKLLERLDREPPRAPADRRSRGTRGRR